MEWSGDGIVIGTRRHGEANAILELMTRERGRHLGLVRGGAGSRLRPVLQPGNDVHVTWRARLDEHLGTYTVEAGHSRMAALLTDPFALHAVSLLAAHLRLLPERDPHPALFDGLAIILDRLDDPSVAGALLVRFELALLDDLGFGLDLEACAATGAREDLTHVSPRTGRAVCRAAAEPYAERLLPLPAFVRGTPSAAREEIVAGFRLTGFFLDRHVWSARGLAEPDVRRVLLGLVAGRA